MAKKIMLGILIIVVGLQFIPVQKTNPPVVSEVGAAPEVMAILERACYDCHSHKTQWPWYSKVAPVSWLLADHVKVGRMHMNLSDWQSMTPEKQAEYMKEIWEEIEKDFMPLKSYRFMHQGARLTETDKEIIHAWALTAQAALPDSAAQETGAESGHDHHSHDHSH